MPMTLTDMQSKTKRLAIKVDDDPEAFVVVYRPHNMTARVEDKVAAANRDGLELTALIHMVLPVVQSWDLRMSADSEPVALTEESLRDVPGDILLMVMEQISADIKPDPKTGQP